MYHPTKHCVAKFETTYKKQSNANYHYSIYVFRDRLQFPLSGQAKREKAYVFESCIQNLVAKSINYAFEQEIIDLNEWSSYFFINSLLFIGIYY